MHRRFVLALGCLLALVGCRADGGPSAPAEGSSSSDTSGATQETPDDEPVPVRRSGVAHGAGIDLVALSPDGQAAITRDQVGGVRLWPRLDGSEEPQVIPASGAQNFSVATAGNGFVVFTVDASGGGKIFEIGADGKVLPRASLPPFTPLVEGHVLPGGRHVLVLQRDKSIVLLSREGKSLVTFKERRFKPDTLRVAENGEVVAALIKTQRKPGAFKTEIQRLKLDVSAAPKIERMGSPRLVETAVEVEASTGTLAPDGRWFAVIERANGSAWTLRAVDLSDADTSVSLEVNVAAHITPSIGFIDKRQTLVTPPDGSLAWLVDWKTKEIRPRTGTAQEFVHQGKVNAIAGGVQATSYGSWLFAHHVKRREHRFLGYQVLQALSVAVSPSGKWVAWGFMEGSVEVESADPEVVVGAVRIGGQPNGGGARVRFFDEDHLIVVDGTGSIALHRWRDGEVLARAGVTGNVRFVDFEPTRKVLLVDRQHNDARVFEVSLEKGFGSPYVVADFAYRLGLLSAKEGPKAPLLWTMDGSQQMRTYSLADLRSDFTKEKIDALGRVVIEQGQPAPMVLDRQGRRYGVRWVASKMEVFIADGDDIQSVAVENGEVNQIIPSPKGDAFAVSANSAQSVAVTVYDRAKLEPKWSYSTGTFNNDMQWSEDGKTLGIAAINGAILLRGSDGKPLRLRCGLDFEVAQAPPPTAFATLNQKSLCEP